MMDEWDARALARLITRVDFIMIYVNFTREGWLRVIFRPEGRKRTKRISVFTGGPGRGPISLGLILKLGEKKTQRGPVFPPSSALVVGRHSSEGREDSYTGWRVTGGEERVSLFCRPTHRRAVSDVKEGTKKGDTALPVFESKRGTGHCTNLLEQMYLTIAGERSKH